MWYLIGTALLTDYMLTDTQHSICGIWDTIGIRTTIMNYIKLISQVDVSWNHSLKKAKAENIAYVLLTFNICDIG